MQQASRELGQTRAPTDGRGETAYWTLHLRQLQQKILALCHAEQKRNILNLPTSMLDNAKHGSIPAAAPARIQILTPFRGVSQNGDPDHRVPLINNSFRNGQTKSCALKLFASQPQALPPEKISTAHLSVSVDHDIAFDLHGSWPFPVAITVCNTSKTGDSRALKTLVEFVRSLNQILRQRYKPDVAAIRQLLLLSAALTRPHFHAEAFTGSCRTSKGVGFKDASSSLLTRSTSPFKLVLDESYRMLNHPVRGTPLPGTDRAGAPVRSGPEHCR